MAILNLLVDAEEYKWLATVTSGVVTVCKSSKLFNWWIIFGQMDKEHKKSASFLYTCLPATSQLCAIAHFLFHYTIPYIILYCKFVNNCTYLLVTRCSKSKPNVDLEQITNLLLAYICTYNYSPTCLSMQ